MTRQLQQIQLDKGFGVYSIPDRSSCEHPLLREAIDINRRTYNDELFVLTSERPHPNLVEVLQPQQVDTQTHYCTRYVEAPRLSEIETRALTLEEKVLLLYDIASALNHLHTMLPAQFQYSGLIHADITPDNILYSSDTGALLFDYDLVYPIGKVYETLCSVSPQFQDSSITGYYLYNTGKCHYMSPEQGLRRELFRANPSIDVYQFASLAIFLLADKFPTKRDNLRLNEELVYSHLSTSHPKLQGVLLRAICFNPRFRTPNVHSFWAELSKALEGMSVELDLTQIQTLRVRY